MVVLEECKGANVDLQAAAEIAEQRGSVKGSTVINSRYDMGFRDSLKTLGCGAIHMGEDQAHRNRLYVSLCERYYTLEGKEETISAQLRHARWVQKENNRRLRERGVEASAMSYDVGKVAGWQKGHEAGMEAGKELGKQPLFSMKMPDAGFGGGMMKAFQTSAVVLMAFVGVIVFLVFVKGKGINAR